MDTISVYTRRKQSLLLIRWNKTKISVTLILLDEKTDISDKDGFKLKEEKL
jgi:hypothetical protein